ncbi:type IV pilin [Halorubrum sp. DTA98]|uniref:type IV pilin n=1 Tax=Halorubrum sp. DTA98 TaxID=3402163 RepID=UPI003AB0D49F
MRRNHHEPRRRGTAPIGVVLLVAIAVVLAAGLAAATLDAPAEPAPTASLSLSVEGDRIELRHRAGDPIHIEEATIHVRVDDEPLDRQPPVPFFSAAGFRPGPTGPFNAASDDVWKPGEAASFAVAGTNDPTLEPGRTVEVRLSARGRQIVTLDATVRSG